MGINPPPLNQGSLGGLTSCTKTIGLVIFIYVIPAAAAKTNAVGLIHGPRMPPIFWPFAAAEGRKARIFWRSCGGGNREVIWFGAVMGEMQMRRQEGGDIESNHKKEIRKFTGVINYYHNMCPRKSHTLAPLTRLTSIKRNFKWTKVKQDAFNKIKRIMACDTLLTYPDFNEIF